jgi:hypothetical protein
MLNWLFPEFDKIKAKNIIGMDSEKSKPPVSFKTRGLLSK